MDSLSTDKSECSATNVEDSSVLISVEKEQFTEVSPRLQKRKQLIAMREDGEVDDEGKGEKEEEEEDVGKAILLPRQRKKVITDAFLLEIPRVAAQMSRRRHRVDKTTG